VCDPDGACACFFGCIQTCYIESDGWWLLQKVLGVNRFLEFTANDSPHDP
jgi:hypothetical protein